MQNKLSGLGQNDLGIGVLADGLDAVEAAGLLGIAFGRQDDLTVGSLQAETELTLLVGIDLELGVG